MTGEQERFEVLHPLIVNGKALYTAFEAVNFSEPRTEQIEVPLFTSSALWAQLRNAVVVRLHAAAKDGTIWSTHDLLQILAAWRRWDDESIVRDVVAAYVEDDESFIALLRQFITNVDVLATGDLASRRRPKLTKKTVSLFLDAETTIARLHEISAGQGVHASVAAELVSLLEQDPDLWD